MARQSLNNVWLSLLIVLASTPAFGAPPTRAPATPTDRHGDALPPGALARFGSLRLRHWGMMRQAVFSPDGKTLATVGWEVRLWDVATGRLRQQLHPWEMMTYDIAFAPDGKQLVTTHISQVHIFDIATAKKQTLWADPTYECGVKKVAISPDGKTIALAGHRREDQRDRPQVRLLDARTHKQLALFEPENGGEIHALLFDPTGKRLAASVGGDLHLWDVAQRKNIAVLKK